jgi:hypothetical protein
MLAISTRNEKPRLSVLMQRADTDNFSEQQLTAVIPSELDIPRVSALGFCRCSL